MAGIDKTYVNREQLKEAVDWAKKVGTVTAENGHTFEPLAFIYHYNDLDDPYFFKEERKEYILWITPTWFDRWLWNNCPLEFVKERLKFQYPTEEDRKLFENFEFDDPKNRLEKGHQHYTFLKEPKGRGIKWIMNHGRKKDPWPDKKGMQTYFMKIESPRYGDLNWRNDLIYDSDTDAWYTKSANVPAYGDYVWQYYHKNPPTKKSIIRELRRRYIPKGYIVKVYQLKYKAMDFEILVR